ncbi:TlpA disulfide reductase family protein [Legionella sp. W10-070]|uniref:TlpA family protein disulfide reductase n=1 Tax=unclassified Legionella TaxID=2622702 RepID=UPI001F5E58E9|nr:TlpA disulfide reductase family protein [Legionella sp. W10-070]MDI9817966.1 TlpA disulfide reductase family protein [Legionella sp. PL877]
MKSILILSLLLVNAVQAQGVVLKELNGKQIPFDSLKGQWVLINYWASWCQPCIDEIAELNRFYQHKKGQLALFAVNYDMLSLEEQLLLVKRYNIRYPSLEEDPARLLQLGDIPGVPATFIFNPKGKLSKTLYGPQTLASLNEAIASS